MGPSCEFVVTKARGYGIHIVEWDGLLDDHDRLSVSFELLDRLSQGNDEWFYDLDAQCISRVESLRFGLHDSTALFVEGPQALAERIAFTFADVRRAG
jgi:hypothetical protein